MADDLLIERCHRAVLDALRTHPSPQGYELLLHPSLMWKVRGWEMDNDLCPGSFATLTGALAVIYSNTAGADVAVFCRTHSHRLDELDGAAPTTDAGKGEKLAE